MRELDIRYFICPLDKIYLGIPAGRTEKIIPVTRVQTAVNETENREKFISLPALFGLKNISTPHGVVLKTPATRKTVLLTPGIDIDLEIPEENISSLPESLSGSYRYFTGACFDDQKVILILDPEKLVEAFSD